MSVREEDRNKNCPSRGLGLAAAAIGVGVGAALYYFFSKRPENPADEGSTSGWEEQPLALHDSLSDSYTTISEHSTTDTSVHDTSSPNVLSSLARRLWHTYSDDDSSGSLDDYESEELYASLTSLDESNQTLDSITSVEETGHESEQSGSDSDINVEWDVTNSSLDVPSARRTPVMMQFGDLTVSLLNPRDMGWNRERAWTLEECSICFEGMLQDQEVFSLACTHRFHQACILPWLEQQQTCPNCRKAS